MASGGDVAPLHLEFLLHGLQSDTIRFPCPSLLNSGAKPYEQIHESLPTLPVSCDDGGSGGHEIVWTLFTLYVPNGRLILSNFTWYTDIVN